LLPDIKGSLNPTPSNSFPSKKTAIKVAAKEIIKAATMDFTVRGECHCIKPIIGVSDPRSTGETPDYTRFVDCRDLA
jgi:hypothetical protein